MEKDVKCLQILKVHSSQDTVDSDEEINMSFIYEEEWKQTEMKVSTRWSNPFYQSIRKSYAASLIEVFGINIFPEFTPFSKRLRKGKENAVKLYYFLSSLDATFISNSASSSNYF